MEANLHITRDGEKRAVTRALRAILYASMTLAIGLVLLLVFASSNTAIFERHYTLLVWATIGLAVLLLLLVLELVRRLVRRYRAGVFGTKLTVRLALSLIAMTLVPATFIYFISVQVLGRSIESWFDVPVERALESGLNLGRAALDTQLIDLNNKARRIDIELSEAAPQQWPAVLEKVREQMGLQDVAVITFSGRIVVASGSQFARLVPDFPTPAALRQVRSLRQFTAVEGGEGSDKSLRIRALRLLTSGLVSEEAKFLQVIQTVPTALAENAEAVQRGQRDYQELSLARQGLKRIYAITLTLTLVLTIFSAIAAAFLLAGWLTGPLTQLADGTRAVAAGDFRPMKHYSGRDELGTLTDSFNRMTLQLGDARAQVQQQRDELLEANLKLEGVLTSINVAVLVFDENFLLELANGPGQMLLAPNEAEESNEPLGATELLSGNTDALFKYKGLTPEQLPWVHQFAGMWREKFAQAIASAGSQHSATWEQQLEIEDRGNRRIWQFKGSFLARDLSLQESGEATYLVVIDELTAMMSAQRATAWSEVARRLAHEIKNPLTPIQLAAERLEQKLSAKLEPADAQLVSRSTATIVNQVNALKQMVDEFREYARLPAAKIEPVRLGDVVDDVLGLYAEGHGGTQIRSNFDPAVPMVLGDSGQLRQIVHNLVKNSKEALEGRQDGLIEVSLEAIRAPRSKPVSLVPSATQNAPNVERRVANVTGVRLIVRDNGTGFSSGIQSREFEPYVTTKAKGTGLGLAIVKKIVDDHGALIDLGQNATLSGTPSVYPGAQVTILFTRLHNNRIEQTDHLSRGVL